MKIVILVENICNIHAMKSEAGFSLYLNDENLKVLFDTGCSNILLGNAHQLGVNLDDLDYIVLSHGHHDHIGGLEYLSSFYEQKENKPSIVMHPLALSQRFKETDQIGLKFPKEKIDKVFNVKKSKEPFWLSDKVVFLGEIDRSFSYEGNYTIGKIVVDGQEKDDYMIDDTALACITSEGLVIIAGCSHSGICNIVEQAKRVCNCDEVRAVIGGFHLKEGQEEQIRETIEYFKKSPQSYLYSCHCTDQYSKFKLKNHLSNFYDISVGSKLEFTS